MECCTGQWHTWKDNGREGWGQHASKVKLELEKGSKGVGLAAVLQSHASLLGRRLQVLCQLVSHRGCTVAAWCNLRQKAAPCIIQHA